MRAITQDLSGDLDATFVLLVGLRMQSLASNVLTAICLNVSPADTTDDRDQTFYRI